MATNYSNKEKKLYSPRKQNSQTVFGKIIQTAKNEWK